MVRRGLEGRPGPEPHRCGTPRQRPGCDCGGISGQVPGGRPGAAGVDRRHAEGGRGRALRGDLQGLRGHAAGRERRLCHAGGRRGGRRGDAAEPEGRAAVLADGPLYAGAARGAVGLHRGGAGRGSVWRRGPGCGAVPHAVRSGGGALPGDPVQQPGLRDRAREPGAPARGGPERAGAWAPSAAQGRSVRVRRGHGHWGERSRVLWGRAPEAVHQRPAEVVRERHPASHLHPAGRDQGVLRGRGARRTRRSQGPPPLPAELGQPPARRLHRGRLRGLRAGLRAGGRALRPGRGARAGAAVDVPLWGHVRLDGEPQGLRAHRRSGPARRGPRVDGPVRRGARDGDPPPAALGGAD
mmetsp:Transcript_83138/g.235217  ORF Transcript_83138/g.235217 Transcript_83138/m.235217 type:complete len:354 (+) Transcript_83138:125-1186(+)